jgi:hypothetical protein
MLQDMNVIPLNQCTKVPINSFITILEGLYELSEQWGDG